MSSRVYLAGVLQYEWNDATSTFTDFTTTPSTSRPYTAAETARAQAEAPLNTAVVNGTDVNNKMSTVDLPAVQTIIADTNANINSNAAARIKDLAVAIRRLEKNVLKQFDTA